MGFIVFVHVVVGVLLVISILLQAGKGGGLAESFSSAESMFGTQTNKFMVRLSTILASLFICTSLILAVNSSKHDKSLMSDKALLPKATAPVVAPQGKAEDAVTIKVEDPKPMVPEQAKPAEEAKEAVAVNAAQ